jgi:heme-degrading monooxygenase HmoA
MIARIWKGETPAAKADAYYDFLMQSGVRDYRATPGNLGVQMLRRTIGDRAEFVLITFWEDYEAVKRFAGDDVEKAHYYPEDQDFLLTFEPTVTHYEVLEK